MRFLFFDRCKQLGFQAGAPWSSVHSLLERCSILDWERRGCRASVVVGIHSSFAIQTPLLSYLCYCHWLSDGILLILISWFAHSRPLPLRVLHPFTLVYLMLHLSAPSSQPPPAVAKWCIILAFLILNFCHECSQVYHSFRSGCLRYHFRRLSSCLLYLTESVHLQMPLLFLSFSNVPESWMILLRIHSFYLVVDLHVFLIEVQC